MSDQVIPIATTDAQRHIWREALEKLDAEILADPQLSEAEKKFLLLEMPQLSDEEWEPIACAGEPVAETIIRSRGVR